MSSNAAKIRFKSLTSLQNVEQQNNRCTEISPLFRLKRKFTILFAEIR